MSASKTTKTPVHLEHPSNLKDPKKRAKFVQKLTDAFVGEVQAARKRMGLPPLK